MSKLRFRVVEEAYNRKAVDVAIPTERPNQYYGKYVFNRQKMAQYLPQSVYEEVAKIEYIKHKTKSDAQVWEVYLINKYKPL